MKAFKYLVWTYIELGEIEKASNLIESLYAFVNETKGRELTIVAEVLSAMRFRAQKKWEESIKHFEKSCQQLKSLNARRWDVYDLAKTLFEYARVYLERDQEGDREKAHTLLNQALELFRKMDAKKDIEKIIAKKSLLTA